MARKQQEPALNKSLQQYSDIGQKERIISALSLKDKGHWLIPLGSLLVGFALVVSAHCFDYSFKKLDVDQLLLSIGSLFMVTAVIQWIFDSAMRRDLINDVVSYASIYDKGIKDIEVNSKDISYGDVILNSRRLTFLTHYSVRIIELYTDQMRKRVEKGLITEVCLLSPKSEAYKFIDSTHKEPGHVADRLKSAASLLKNLDPSGDKIKIFYFDRVLRYSAVLSDEGIWVKALKNSPGRQSVPGILVRSGSPLGTFYEADIEKLKDGCTS